MRARISYGNSVRLSVCPSVRLSRPGTDSRPGEIETPDLHHRHSLQCLVSHEVILVPLGEELPLERGHQRGVLPSPLEVVILPLLAHLA